MICILQSICHSEILISTEASEDYYTIRTVLYQYYMTVIFFCTTTSMEIIWLWVHVRSFQTDIRSLNSSGSRSYTSGALGTLPPGLSPSQSKSADESSRSVIVTEAQKSFASLTAMTQQLINLSESAEYWVFHDQYSRITLFPECLLKTEEVMQDKVLSSIQD